MPNVVAPAPRFQGMLEKWASDDLDKIAMVKRFVELLVGDPAFRLGLKEGKDTLTALFRKNGLSLDPEAVRPLYDSRVSQFRFENGGRAWPDVNLWDAFLKEKIAYRDAVRRLGDEGNLDVRFAAWRSRQMERCASELGGASDAIVHAISSYELSSGCTMGCWFCGVSAESFQGSYALTDANERLWRSILEVMRRRFGQASQTGFCYWATDPMDNPEYSRFIEIHHDVTGMLPQTTTAAPMRDIARTKEIIALTERLDGTMNRFSILTLPVLRRIFANFTPRELLGTELVMQHREALTRKSLAGRVARDQRGLNDESALGQPGTIACVTGFLVNMRERRVRLVSPCPTSESQPDGFHTFGEGKFESADAFDGLISRLIDENMPEAPVETMSVSFRGDLQITETQDGFVAQSTYRRQTYSHPIFGRDLGVLIRDGDKDLNSILCRLTGSGANPLDVRAELTSLRRRALLHERY